jgi:hypothetical protein
MLQKVSHLAGLGHTEVAHLLEHQASDRQQRRLGSWAL